MEPTAWIIILLVLLILFILLLCLNKKDNQLTYQEWEKMEHHKTTSSKEDYEKDE